MYADILRSIVGIEVFPIVSLLLFVAVFGGVLVWALRADRARLDRHAALPLLDALRPEPGREPSAATAGSPDDRRLL